MESYYQLYVRAGGIMMFLLIPCSLFAIAYVVQGFINLRRGRLIPGYLAKLAAADVSELDCTTIQDYVKKSDSLLGRVLKRLFNHITLNDISSEVMNDVIEDEVSRLYQRNSHLIVIYSVAPLIGLLGTVLGMMKSFYLFSSMDNPSVAALSRGINEALVTTMWGLFIAIPSFLVVNLFRYRLLRYQRDILPDIARNIVNTCANVKEDVEEPNVDELQETSEDESELEESGE